MNGIFKSIVSIDRAREGLRIVCMDIVYRSYTSLFLVVSGLFWGTSDYILF